MLEKILSIKNVGKFRDCNAAGDVAFRPLTLIYAENARGKTTFCDILRSLTNDRADLVLGRTTLTATDSPHVRLLINGQTVTFKDESWDTTIPDIAIYDTTFVHENVYTGDHVDHDHKKNLYRIIVGAEGVSLAKAVETLDEAIRESNRKLSAAKRVATAHVPNGTNLDAFIKLAKVEDVDAKIKEKETSVSALTRSKEIKQKDLLKELSLPIFPDGFAQLLGKKLDDVSKDAEAQIRRHLLEATKNATETWLSEGFEYLRDDTCPFCSQQVSPIPLIAAYRSYFSQSYADHKSKIAEMKCSVVKFAEDAVLLDLQGNITTNTALSTFWNEFVDLQPPTIEFSELRDPLQELTAAAVELIDQKEKAPLEPTAPTQRFETTLAALEKTKILVDAYNSAVRKANVAITAKKVGTESGDLQAAKWELAALENTKKRHEEDADQACSSTVRFLLT